VSPGTLRAGVARSGRYGELGCGSVRPGWQGAIWQGIAGVVRLSGLRLGLARWVEAGQCRYGTADCVAVKARHGVDRSGEVRCGGAG